MKKTSSPTRSCSHLLLTVTALLFLSIPTNAQWKAHQIFNKGVRLNDSGALSLHPNIPFEIDEPNVVGGRFRVTTTGLVGIGVISPTEKLEVAGKIKADGIRIKKGLLSLHPDATFNIDEPGIVGGRFTIGKDGNVGIGNNKPHFPLDVVNQTGTKGVIAQFFNANRNNGIHIGATVNEVAGMAPGAKICSINQEHLYINPDGGDIHLGSPFSTATNVYGSGRFNLGHVTTENLTVSENITTNGLLRVENGALSIHPSASLVLDDIGQPGERFIVTSIGEDGTGGNVGIGTSWPTEKLEVEGNIYANGKIIAEKGLEIAMNDGKDALTVAPNGYVGIGYIYAPERLAVKGNIKATGQIIAGGNIKATGNLLLENDDDPDNPIPVFQVSTAEQLTFIGSEAYTKWTENNTNKDSELYKNKDKYSLWVSKGIVSEDYVMASVDAWADYVFDPGYKLRSLEELSHFVRTNKHLPNIPSEAEVKQEGYSLHELNRGFLKTIEELTLHTIAQEEKMKTLNSKLEQLKAALAQLQQDQD